MQRLDTLWKIVNAASAVKDLAVESRTFQFITPSPVTLYLHAEYAEVTLSHWEKRQIEIRAQLQAGFGWRVKTEQDDAGVYLVARRRMLVGNLSRARFDVFIPQDTYLILKLNNGQFRLDDLNGTLHLTPPDTNGHLTIRTE